MSSDQIVSNASGDGEASRQREDLQRVLRDAMFAVDDFALTHCRELSRVTSASYSALLVGTALGYLIGHGLIRVAPEGEGVFALPMGWQSIPEHLRPDLAGALAEAERLRSALNLP